MLRYIILTMKKDDARTIPGAALYERRKQAIKLFKSGYFKENYSAIARHCGATRQSVKKWISAWKAGGITGLKPQTRGRIKGDCRKLTSKQEKDICKSITDSCPDQLKLPFALWTRKAVKMLIMERFGLEMPIRTVGEYLKRWGFTPQKPIRRAYERNEAKVQEWKEVVYPQIVKKAKKEKGEIHWADETGIRSDDVNGRSYAPKGKTPVQRVKGTPEKLNMISTVSNQGKVHFMFYKEMMSTKILISFLKRLFRNIGRKVFLILDNLKVHHSKDLQTWLEEHKVEIEIFYLPSYSPDLNPDEFMNSDLKSALSQKPDARAKGRLERNALGHMKSVQKRPQHVKNFFNAASISYASVDAEKLIA